jgi:hypothetical protein
MTGNTSLTLEKTEELFGTTESITGEIMHNCPLHLIIYNETYEDQESEVLPTPYTLNSFSLP